MKTTNTRSGTLSLQKTRVKLPFYETDRTICYYANIEKGEKRKEWRWKVGSKNNGDNKEYSFKLTKLGDVEDDAIWNKITQADFAIKLIAIFRAGEETAIKEWIKGGCL